MKNELQIKVIAGVMTLDKEEWERSIKIHLDTDCNVEEHIDEIEIELDGIDTLTEEEKKEIVAHLHINGIED